MSLSLIEPAMLN